MPALFPFGAEGTTAWLKAASDAFDIDEMHFNRVIAPGRERAKRALAQMREKLSDKRIFFMPDSQLEIPLARFLFNELGMNPIEVGTPYLHKTHLAHEAACRRQPSLAKGKMLTNSLTGFAQGADLTVCGLGLANPLENESLSNGQSS